MPALTFCFDLISPYAYLAWKALPALAARTGAEVELRPVVLGPLLDAAGSLGPAEIPPKRAYMFRHLLRLAADAGVPFAPPPAHPFNPLLALRVARAAGPAIRPRVVDALFAAAWGGGAGVEDAAAITAALGAELARELLPAAATAEVKAALRRDTEDLVARGGFGVPTFLVGDELVWGYDAMPHVERILRGEDHLDQQLLERWRTLPASVQRRR